MNNLCSVGYENEESSLWISKFKMSISNLRVGLEKMDADGGESQYKNGNNIYEEHGSVQTSVCPFPHLSFDFALIFHVLPEL